MRFYSYLDADAQHGAFEKPDVYDASDSDHNSLRERVVSGSLGGFGGDGPYTFGLDIPGAG